MAVVPPGSKILVSGANGYIAVWVIRKLLEQGYHVRGAARSEAKLKHLKEYFKSYADNVERVVVKDITQVCRVLLSSVEAGAIDDIYPSRRERLMKP